MSIQLFTGNPGGGKSYDVIRNRFIPNFKKGREIWTNLDGLNLDYICALEGVPEHFKDNIVYLVDDIDFEMLSIEESEKINNDRSEVQGNWFWRWWVLIHTPSKKKSKSSFDGIQITPNGRKVCSVWEFYKHIPVSAMAIIDEAQDYWGSRDYKEVDEAFDSYLTRHRKGTNDIIFITQKPANIYKKIQRLAEYVWFFEKLTWLGAPNRYKAQVSIGLDGKRTYKHHVRSYDKRYFPCYTSYTANDIKEQQLESTTVFSKPLIIGFCLLFFFVLYKFTQLPWFHGKSVISPASAELLKRPEKKDMSKDLHGEKNVNVQKAVYEASRDNEKLPVKALYMPQKSVVPVQPLSQPVSVSNYRISGMGSGDSFFVSIEGAGVFDLHEFNKKFKKGAYYANGKICFDGSCFSVGDSFDG